MTLQEVIAQRIERIRSPKWRNQNCYLKLQLLPNGGVGPWFELWDRVTQEAIGAETPQTFPGGADGAKDWEAYAGPIDPDDAPPAGQEGR